MARTTTIAVQTLLGPNYDGSQPLQQYVDSASVVVDRAVVLATAASQSYGATELELMERWLACHYYCQTDPMFTSKKTGDASGSYRDASYLDGARQVDPLGFLAAALSKRRAGVTWAGKKPWFAIPYDQRT